MNLNQRDKPPRAQHRHHGLTLSNKNMSKDADVKTASLSLAAKPLAHSNGDRFGTFDLWHRSCRETPTCGILTNNDRGKPTVGFQVLLSSEDKRLPYIPIEGITLFDCLTSLPDLSEFMGTLGELSNVIRAQLTVDQVITGDTQWVIKFNLAIHPSRSELYSKFINNIKIRPDLVDGVFFYDYESYGTINFRITQDTPTAPLHYSFPNGSMLHKNEVRFWPEERPLNEFGYYYVALYIVGNYARCFPDKWLHDVEVNSPLALAVAALLHSAAQRMALLTYGELSRVYQVVDD